VGEHGRDAEDPMPLPDAFDSAALENLFTRLDALTPSTQHLWGRMDVAQMLAHCCVPYEQLQGKRGGGPWLLRFLARHFFKQKVVGEPLYGRNIPTPDDFKVADPRDFANERERLRGLVREFHAPGAAAFEGRVHVAFGPLTAREWSNLLWKHLDHHLRQFGA
jgi:hypothetical protein